MLGGFIFGVVIGILAFVLIRGLIQRKRLVVGRPPIVRVEYWIYCNAQERPSDAAILDYLLKSGPFAKSGKTIIGPAEGITLSDVRFHIGLAKKKKNPLMFRPEIIAEVDTEYDKKIIALASESETIIIVRYISEDPPKDLNYLQFVTHCVHAIANLVNSQLIFDVEEQKFWELQTFLEAIQRDLMARGHGLHVATRWVESSDEGNAFTRGMAKAGMPDLYFSNHPLDQRIISTYLVEESSRSCWQDRDLSAKEIDGYGERFIVEFERPVFGVPSHRGWVTFIHAGRKREPEMYA